MREAAFMGLGLFANINGTNIFSFGSHKNGELCQNLWQYVPACSFIRLHIEDWIQLWLKANPLANWLSLLQVKLRPNFLLSIHSLLRRTNGHLTKTVSQSRAEWSRVQSCEESLRILPGYSRNLGPKICTSSVIFSWLLRWQCTFPPTFVRSFWCAEIRHCRMRGVPAGLYHKIVLKEPIQVLAFYFLPLLRRLHRTRKLLKNWERCIQPP